MPLPKVLTHEVQMPRCKYPTWQVSPMTDAERAEVDALLPVLEHRLVPADPAEACKLVEDALRAANPSAIDDSSAAWIAALTAGYSLDTLRASLEFCGVSDLRALSEDLRRRRDNATIFRYRARVLLCLQPAEWYETPGAPVPDGPDKPFDKPMFGGLCAPLEKAA